VLIFQIHHRQNVDYRNPEDEAFIVEPTEIISAAAVVVPSALASPPPPSAATPPPLFFFFGIPSSQSAKKKFLFLEKNNIRNVVLAFSL